MTMLTSLLATTAGAAALSATTPTVFQPYLDAKPPVIVEELPETEANGIAIREFWFRSRTLPSSGEAYDIVKMLKEDMKVYFVDAMITYHNDGKYELAQN